MQCGTKLTSRKVRCSVAIKDRGWPPIWERSAFFAKAGFHPPEVWVYIAAIAETAAGIALVLGICTRFAAFGACAVLAIAVYSLQVVKGFGWTWNTGGYEYPVFWAIASLCVAIEAWKAHFVPVQRPAHGSPFVSRAPLVH